MAKKQINDIYVDYFQKSKVFLFPALGIKRGTSVTPIETYLIWGDTIKQTDRKLACLYYLRDDDEFVGFEDRYLFNNPMFEEYYQVDNDKAVYVFNFDEYSEDFDNVVDGKYSQLSQELKIKIKDVYGSGSANYDYIKTYLYPEYYYDRYAEILSPNPLYISEMLGILRETGELCAKPDLDKEELKISVSSLKL